MSTEVTIPGSKSITNRTAFLAAAAGGTTVLERPLVSDDSVAFLEGLRQLGVRIERGDDERWTIEGLDGGPAVSGADVWCADAATAARFLPALAAVGHCHATFAGSEQLQRRPMGPLLDALRALGAEVAPSGTKLLPFEVVSQGLEGGEIVVDSSSSSQFLSALLMAGPLTRAGLSLSTPSRPVSAPYLDMTTRLMGLFGVEVTRVGETAYRVESQRYVGTRLGIEPDASSASYFFAAAALTGREIVVPGLGSESLQGDLGFVHVLGQMGAEARVEPQRTVVRGTGILRGGEIAMGDISDTFMTLAAIAPFADGPVRISGVDHARVKESDRVEAVAGNLRRLGVPVATGHDWIEIRPATPSPGQVHCHRDHRIAMSFAVLALRARGVTLDDPDCVAKTFPGFHSELRAVTRQWQLDAA